MCRVDALVLAAGASERFGGIKQVATLEGAPLVRRSVDAALSACRQVFVALGANAPVVQAALDGLDLSFFWHEQWSRGMGSTLAAASQHIAQQEVPPQALLILLADQGLVTRDDVTQLLAAGQTSPRAIIAAQYGTTVGAPCLFPAEFFTELGRLDGARGARGLLDRHATRVLKIPMPHAAIDIDTPEDLTRARDRISASS